MQRFTIRDIENLTGIKAHTLRIWEQRYSFSKPQRKESQHRFYDNEDLKKLLQISFLYHQGWKVSRISGLTGAQIEQEVRQAKVSADNYTLFLSQLLEAAVNFNEAGFTRQLDEVISVIGFEKCIVEVCYPYLNKLGLLWNTSNIIPAQEHFSSYIIQNRIIVETQKLSFSHQKPEIALACPQGEFHELPLLFIHYLLRKNGWSTVFLGSNVGKAEMAYLLEMESIQFLYLHLLTNFTGLTVDDYMEDICRLARGKTIVASGEGIRNAQRSFVNLRLLRSDEQIYAFIHRTTSAARDF